MSSAFKTLRTRISPCLQDLAERYHRCYDELHRVRLLESYVSSVEELLNYLVIWQHRALHSLGVPREDMMQWARLAALEALDRYDCTRGSDFAVYLVSYVKRYVYNKVLDDLPVPRDISKRIRAYQRNGYDVEDLPEHLYNAYMLRSPVLLDSSIMESAFGYNDDEYDETVLDIMDLLGKSLWQQLLSVMDDCESSTCLEHTFVSLRRLRDSCPVDLIPYLDNLTDYITSMMERRYGVEVHHCRDGSAGSSEHPLESRSPW